MAEPSGQFHQKCNGESIILAIAIAATTTLAIKPQPIVPNPSVLEGNARHGLPHLVPPHLLRGMYLTSERGDSFYVRRPASSDPG